MVFLLVVSEVFGLDVKTSGIESKNNKNSRRSG